MWLTYDGVAFYVSGHPYCVHASVNKDLYCADRYEGAIEVYAVPPILRKKLNCPKGTIASGNARPVSYCCFSSNIASVG
jgi:hypothetical protein